MKDIYKILITIIICAVILAIGFIAFNYINNSEEIVANTVVNGTIASFIFF